MVIIFIMLDGLMKISSNNLCRIFNIICEEYIALTLKNSCIQILITQVEPTFKILLFESEFYTSTDGTICGRFNQQQKIRDTQSLSIVFNNTELKIMALQS